MTVRELLDVIDSTVQNDVDDGMKIKWINDVEGRALCEIHKMPPEQTGTVISEDDELALPDAYSRAYLLFVASMIEFSKGNYGDYGKLTVEFEKALELYAKWYIRNL